MDTEEQLIGETDKWLGKAQERIVGITANDKKGEEFLTNIKAYIDDTKHFSEQDDHIRAFEAIVWAWAWIEIGLDNEIIKEKE